MLLFQRFSPWRTSPLPVFAAIWLALVCWPLAASSAPPDPHTLMQNMAHAYDGITDYTALFLKRERAKGALRRLEHIELRFQEPFKVYMAWQKPYVGRVVTFIKGEHNDRILIKPGGLFKSVRLALAPTSPLVTRGAHHSILQAGIGNTIQHIMREYQRGKEQGQLTLYLHGDSEVDGRAAYHLEFVYPADKAAGYYAYRGELWIDKASYLPTKVLIYDWENQLYEHYEYHRLRLNPGLGPEAFRLEPGMPEKSPQVARLEDEIP